MLTWDITGYIAAFLFVICAIPQVWKCLKTGNAEGVSAGFMLLWLGGEIALLINVITCLNWYLPYLLNAISCMFFCLIIIKYIYFPRKDKTEKIPVIKNLYKRGNYGYRD